MTLRNVWLSTLADGLIRADQVVGVHAHRTPTVGGKPSHWLLDVVLDAATGGGRDEQWALSPLHRTLVQTSGRPKDAATHLVRLLAQLDTTNAAGIVTTGATDAPSGPAGGEPLARVRFRFSPFQATEPGHRYDPDYL